MTDKEIIEAEEKRKAEFKGKNVVFMDHPLIQHKISILRNETTGTNEFRKLVEEIARLEGYEALRDLPLEYEETKTPITTTLTPYIAGKKLCLVPILRAGLGMVEGLLSLCPTAKVGFIGMYRDEETKIPHEYYCKIPSPIEQRTIVCLDPMLATGGSACDAPFSDATKLLYSCMRHGILFTDKCTQKTENAVLTVFCRVLPPCNPASAALK